MNASLFQTHWNNEAFMVTASAGRAQARPSEGAGHLPDEDLSGYVEGGQPLSVGCREAYGVPGVEATGALQDDRPARDVQVHPGCGRDVQRLPGRQARGEQCGVLLLDADRRLVLR